MSTARPMVFTEAGRGGICNPAPKRFNSFSHAQTLIETRSSRPE